MEQGKRAGVRCVQLTPDGLCRLFGKPSRPDICNRLTPSLEMCGADSAEALRYLANLERATTPEPSSGNPAPSDKAAVVD